MNTKIELGNLSKVPFLDVVLKYRRSLVFIGLVVAVITFVFTKFFIKPEYEAKAVIYAAKVHHPDVILPPQEFGYANDSDGLIQMMNSKPLRDKVIDKFDLIEHYDVDTTDKAWRYDLDKEFFRNVWIDRTDYNSIDINVNDVSADTAAMMANFIVEAAGELKSQALKSNNLIVLKDRRREFVEKKAEVDSLQQVLGEIGAEVDPTNSFNPKNIAFERNYRQYKSELGRLNHLKVKWEVAQNHYDAEIPTYYKVSEAEPKYKKIYPKVVLTVFLTTLPILLFSIIIFAITEKVNQLKNA